MSSSGTTELLLKRFHRTLDACQRCPKMSGPVVHGPPIHSPILLVGQAPGPREGSFGRPFAWTAGKTLFSWFHAALGAPEAEVRARIYFAAVARCFPGKAPGGGDRRPDPVEIDNCRPHLEREVQLLKPRLVIPVGTLAIEQVMAYRGPLREVVGTTQRLCYHGVDMEALPLPHPSGASTWHRTEPGKTLLHRALRVLAKHPVIRQAFAVHA
ncbi:MAG: uracil-DNA glycosylase family protein [Myxococcaceae bacterium]